MFDERRQTTVKGIDRSYPLEPLENKSRKQTNGNGVQKNGNLTVNRQSVTVKRVARADVNSNLNGGKPIVSYHEEISRESFGPCARQHQEDDEFGNENHVAQYANGNHRDEVTHHFPNVAIFPIEIAFLNIFASYVYTHTHTHVIHTVRVGFKLPRIFAISEAASIDLPRAKGGKSRTRGAS